MVADQAFGVVSMDLDPGIWISCVLELSTY
jgi:hypothetical protein